MFPTIETPVGTFELYGLAAILGAVVAVVVQMILLYRWTRQWRCILFSALYGLYSWLGGYGSSVVRLLSYEDGGRTGGFWNNVAGDYGKHYLGTVLVIAVLAVPGTFALYKLLFRQQREWKKYMLHVTNALAVGILLQHIFGRLGCFARGCCFGIPYQGIFSVTFPYGEVSYAVFPTQLFEILCALVLLIIIGILLHRGKAVFGIALTGFAVIIILSEFLIDKRGTRLFYGISVIQWFAILLGIIGVGYIIWMGKLQKAGGDKS